MVEDNLFTYIKAINNKSEVKYDKKIAGAYIITLWLSHSYDIINKVNDINKYQFSLPDQCIYNYYYHSIPKKNRFIKWIKKKTFNKEKQKQIENLAEQYNISKREAEKSLC